MKSNRSLLGVSAILLALVAWSGCRNVGFRDLGDPSRNGASVQTARDLMVQLQQGLHSFYLTKHHYPMTTGAYLYDSIGRLVDPPIDAIHLYRNDNGRGYFLAVGGRADRIIYNYPPTVGPGEYTLYWVGPNGVDESDEGDDVDAWTSNDERRKFERRRTIDLDGNGTGDHMMLMMTGDNIATDSVRFSITDGDTLRYADGWPLTAYFTRRPELSESQERRLVHFELDQFFNSAAFVSLDTINVKRFGGLTIAPAELAAMKAHHILLFNYHRADGGSRGIVWSPTAHRFVTAWNS